ncbi:MAG: DUF1579 domain-containing protein [Planctomycetes bacterium]|nr:DUF1579 domain-containing protein [Planctomycetota bacterium]
MSTECDFAEMSAATEDHKRLEPFVGTFKAEVKMWMGPGDPMVSTGKITNTFDLEGRFLHQVYTGDPNDGPFANFEGRGYWGYNKTTKKYEGFWIDSASTIMQTESGKVDAGGKVWTMIGEMTGSDGNPMKKRSVITLQDNDHHLMEMYFGRADGSESKGMEIRYERVSG